MSYTLTSPRVAELLVVARAILTGVVAGQPHSSKTCGSDRRGHRLILG